LNNSDRNLLQKVVYDTWSRLPRNNAISDAPIAKLGRGGRKKGELFVQI